MKSGLCNDQWTTTIRPLDTEEDWESIRTRVEELERASVMNPWWNWEYIHEQWRTFMPDRRTWMVEVVDAQAEGKPALAIGLWREYVFTGRRFRPKALRSFDHIYFMRTPPFLARRGHEATACRAMADAMGELRRQSKASLISLNRMDEGAVSPLLGELSRRGIPFKQRVWTPAPQLVFEPPTKEGESPEEQFDKRHKKALRDMRRQERRLEERFGDAAEIFRFEAKGLSEEEYQACVARFRKIEAKTWQHQWEDQSARVDPELKRAFEDKALGIWRRRGILDFHFLRAGGKCASFFVTLRGEDRLWLLLTGYDPELKDFGVGKMLLMRMIPDLFKLGIRWIEFGGEVLGWKEEWANRYEPVYQIEWGLGGWKGHLLRLVHRLRPVKQDKVTRD